MSLSFANLVRLVATVIVLAPSAPSHLLAASPIQFQQQIRPILSNKCFACHGPDAESRQADLRLDDEQDVMRDREGQHVVDRQRPTASTLLERITTEADDQRMPPPEARKPLLPHERELLVKWIQLGAPWADHWAYVPPQRYPNPTITNKTWASWARNWIDSFVLEQLAQHGLQPSPRADAVTLQRRLHFDLTGLPPTEHDTPPDIEGAYEPLVDRLLASPAFGERMAMAWLDVVRYADTVGYHGDQDHNISPYRDYVIDAFQTNLPFDRFTQEQLAGDLLPNPTTEQITASGYNRLLQTTHEGGLQPKEYLAIYAADRVRNLSAVWLGATLGCAQCHDHKFDPFTMRDFYSLQAFFADLDEDSHFKNAGNSLPTQRAPEIPVLSRRERVQRDIWQTRLAQNSDANPRLVEGSPAWQAQKFMAQIDQAARVTMISAAIAPRETRILPRGNWMDDSGPVVLPSVPNCLPPCNHPTDQRLTRLDLARWLTDPRQGHGLFTARIFVNRVWYLLLGRGLVKSMDDFGAQGEPPTHPQLLDQLAHTLVDSGWDVKHLIRTIVCSATYQQSSLVSPELQQLDPENRWIARQGRWRLPAEMVRDALLQASGLLVHELGGASVRPYQPEGYYRHLNFPVRTYQHHADRRQWRRGLYVHWQRQFLHPMLKAFDAPSREECTAERPRSNTPLAALALLNDPSSVEAARGLAQRILGETPPHATWDERAAFAFQCVMTRPPRQSELQVLRSLQPGIMDKLCGDAALVQRITTVGLAPVPPTLDRLELASWTMICRVLLNLDETITRN